METASLLNECKIEKDFETEFKAFSDILDQVLCISFKRSIDIGKNPQELDSLDKFNSAFSKMGNNQIFMTLFQKIYFVVRDDVPNTLDDDSWLKSGIDIQLGRGKPKVEKEKITIMLSKIYNHALKLQENARDLGTVSTSRTHFYPQMIQYYLIKIFYIIQENDRDYLYPILSRLEELTGVKNRVTPPPSFSRNSLSSMFEMLGSAASKFGLKDPQGKPLNGDSITNMVSKLTESDFMKDALKSLESVRSGEKDIKQVVSETVEKLGTDEHIKMLHEMQSGFNASGSVSETDVKNSVKKFQEGINSMKPTLDKVTEAISNPNGINFDTLIKEGSKIAGIDPANISAEGLMGAITNTFAPSVPEKELSDAQVFEE